MKRLTWTMLVFAALALTAVGCRRNSDAPKRPAVEVSVASDFIIPPRLVKAEELAKREKAAPRPNFDPDYQQMLKTIGKKYAEYLSSGQASKLNIEDLKLSLLRRGADDARKAVEDKTIDVVLEADATYPDHIVAYKRDAADGKNDVVFVNQASGKVDGNGLPIRLLKQALQTVYAQYKGYAAQAPQKSLGDFTAYLKIHAQPAVADAVATLKIKVNVAAQLGNEGHMVACFGKADPNLGFQDSVLGIMGNGTIRPLTPAFVQAVFPGK